MKYHIAQLNIAQFRLPPTHPANIDFVSNLDKVNAIAESQDGFVWRFIGDVNNAMDVQAFDDPHMVINMSVWTDIESLSAFAYRNKEHRQIMRRRNEWFDKIEFHLVLWWVEEGYIPTLNEATAKLTLVSEAGPTAQAFPFKSSFPAPSHR